jgi:hypothetical protein
VQVHLADALEAADEEGVGREQLARRRALDVALAEAGVELLQEGGLLGGDLDRLPGVGLLQRQPAVDPRPEAVVVEVLLDGDRGDPPALERQHRLEAIAAVGRMLECQRPDPLDHLRRRGLRMAPVDRRQVLQPLEALRLEPTLPLVEARPVEAPLPAGLRDVAKLPGQLQHAQTMLRHLRRGIPRHGPLRCR